MRSALIHRFVYKEWAGELSIWNEEGGVEDGVGAEKDDQVGVVHWDEAVRTRNENPTHRILAV